MTLVTEEDTNGMETNNAERVGMYKVVYIPVLQKIINNVENHGS